MSENRDDAPMEPERGEEQVKLLAGRVVSVLGMLVALGGIAYVLFSSTAASANVSAGAVALVFGLAGYLLGSRRLGTATMILAVLAVFFSLAATQGIIPGSEPTDRSLPQRQPGGE